MSEIVKSRASFTDLGDVNTELEVRKMLAQLEAVKDALKAADEFREKSVMYAQYEAYALVRAVEISGDTHLIKGKWRKLAAEWLASMPEDERGAYIAKCSDGKTIDNVYKAVVFLPEQRSALGNAVSECKAAASDALRKDGVVSIQSIVGKYQGMFPRAMIGEITDGVRSVVRSAGGVGIGDGNGTYVDPEKKSLYVSQAIATRIDAVTRDIESIADLSSKCESKPTFRIKGDGTQIGFADVTYMILAGVGCANVTFDNAAAKKKAVSILRQIAGDVR